MSRPFKKPRCNFLSVIRWIDEANAAPGISAELKQDSEHIRNFWEGLSRDGHVKKLQVYRLMIKTAQRAEYAGRIPKDTKCCVRKTGYHSGRFDWSCGNGKTSDGNQAAKDILVMILFSVLVAGRVATAKVHNNSMIFL